MPKTIDTTKSQSEVVIPVSAFVTLFALILANISSLLDRSIMALLVQPIKQDLEISDVQFGLLHGLAFALLYCILGVPIGRLVDKYNRIHIITLGISVWSLMTALCGMAHNFITLFLARVGVGVGEAALNPAAYSILSDCFPRRYLARAVGAFMMATYVGVGLSYVLGGILVNAFDGASTVMLPGLGEIKAWKAIFFIAAVPGFFIALGILFVKEPQRKGLKYTRGHGETAESVSLAELWKFLKENKKSLITHFFGFVGGVTFANGLLLWSPTIIHQNHDIPIGVVGQGFGVLLMIVGGIGPYLGGWISDVADKRHISSAPISTAIVLAVLGILPAASFAWMSSLTYTYVLLSLVILIMTAQISLAITALQLITPNELRGQVSAIFLLLVNICGIGFGPALIPFLAETLNPAAPSLNLSVSILGCVAFLISICSLSIGRSAYRDSDRRMNFE